MSIAESPPLATVHFPAQHAAPPQLLMALTFAFDPSPGSARFRFAAWKRHPLDPACTVGSLEWFVSGPRFIQTIRILMSAGDTPEMREA
jgi:hypothetical protein